MATMLCRAVRSHLLRRASRRGTSFSTTRATHLRRLVVSLRRAPVVDPRVAHRRAPVTLTSTPPRRAPCPSTVAAVSSRPATRGRRWSGGSAVRTVRQRAELDLGLGISAAGSDSRTTRRPRKAALGPRRSAHRRVDANRRLVASSADGRVPAPVAPRGRDARRRGGMRLAATAGAECGPSSSTALRDGEWRDRRARCWLWQPSRSPARLAPHPDGVRAQRTAIGGSRWPALASLCRSA